MPENPKTLSFVSDEPPEGLGLQVAPLIDIVFLLICFYLLVSQLVTSQKDASVELPEMTNPVVRNEGPAEFVINLRADGTATIDRRPAALPAIRAMLRAQLERAAQTRQPLRVAIRADRWGRFGKLDDVLGICRDAGLEWAVVRCRKGQGP
ncbi:MAG TPA: biopolymer transporter ExbD [Phycisphaerae bacterium]|nr:biopolymer transporter ExbD [Phycisphaerae bacterium]HUU21712.1 biopolymer transporter ExbD [Phycisphaerae bacterium]